MPLTWSPQQLVTRNLLISPAIENSLLVIISCLANLVPDCFPDFLLVVFVLRFGSRLGATRNSIRRSISICGFNMLSVLSLVALTADMVVDMSSTRRICVGSAGGKQWVTQPSGEHNFLQQLWPRLEIAKRIWKAITVSRVANDFVHMVCNNMASNTEQQTNILTLGGRCPRGTRGYTDAMPSSLLERWRCLLAT